MELLEICKQAKEVKQQIAVLSTVQKNQALSAVADKLVEKPDAGRLVRPSVIN